MYKVPDTILVNLHSKQSVLAHRRQPQIHSQITSILELATRSKGHPYDLEDKEYRALATVPDYADRKGPVARLAETVKFLYRIERIAAIRFRVTNFTDATLAGMVDSKEFARALTRRFQPNSKPTHDGKWPSLSSIASGQYANPRNMAWWCPVPPSVPGDPRDVISSAAKSGLCHEHIPIDGVILRVAVPKIDKSNLSIPTIHEAFDQPVFLPITCGKCDYGISIDLSNTDLAYGNPECLSGPLPVGSIDILPFRLSASDLSLAGGTSLLEKSDALRAFYEEEASGN